MAATTITGTQNVTADTGTPGEIDQTDLGDYSGQFLVAVVVPTGAAGPVSLTQDAAETALTGVQIPVPTTAGQSVAFGPFVPGVPIYLYAAAPTVCRVSLIRVQ